MGWRVLGLWVGLMVAVVGVLGLGRLIPSPGTISYRSATGDTFLHDPVSSIRLRVLPQGWPSGAWSPTGRWWYALRWDGDTLALRLTTTGGTEVLRVERELPTATSPRPFNTILTFSPDDTMLVQMTSIRSQDAATAELFLDVASVKTGYLFHYQPEQKLAARQLYWNPDGHTIADLYRQSNPGGLFQLGVTLIDSTTGDITPYDYSDRMSYLAPEIAMWSPDGRWLAFIGGEADERERFLYLTTLDGTLTQVSRAGTLSLDYAWKPGEAVVAYSEPGPIVAIYDANAETVIDEVYTGPDTIAHPLAWTPDGEGLLVRWLVGSEVPSSRQHVGLWQDGTLTELDTFEGGVGVVRWSPDGTRALLGVRDRGQRDVYLLDSATGVLRPLTEQGVNNFDPQWSRDGTWVLFNSERDGLRGAYLMRPDGTEVRQVSPPNEEICCPRWITLD